MSSKTKKCEEETLKHIDNVCKFLWEIIKQLGDRAISHDDTKLKSPELEVFTEYTEKLAGCTYGSDEYKGFLKSLKPALDHHYANNRHHPEHHDKGVDDMTLIDVVEMFSDWKAATLRHNDGDIIKSIEHNTDRFNLSPQLAKILKNTAEDLGWDNKGK